MSERSITLTETQVRDIVRDSVHETLVGLGMSPSDPHEMQKDFNHLRDTRLAVEMIKRRSIVTLVGILITGAVALLWLGVQGLRKGG